MTLLWIILFSVLLQDPVDVLLLEAERAYERRDFEQAISLYEQVVLSESESGGLFYNLGNAYYSAGFLGEALVNYQRHNASYHAILRLIVPLAVFVSNESIFRVKSVYGLIVSPR